MDDLVIRAMVNYSEDKKFLSNWPAEYRYYFKGKYIDHSDQLVIHDAGTHPTISQCYAGKQVAQITLAYLPPYNNFLPIQRIRASLADVCLCDGRLTVN